MLFFEGDDFYPKQPNVQSTSHNPDEFDTVTCEEFRSKAKNLHRSEHYSPHNVRIINNLQSFDDHLAANTKYGSKLWRFGLTLLLLLLVVISIHECCEGQLWCQRNGAITDWIILINLLIDRFCIQTSIYSKNRKKLKTVSLRLVHLDEFILCCVFFSKYIFVKYLPSLAFNFDTCLEWRNIETWNSTLMENCAVECIMENRILSNNVTVASF